MLQRSFQTQTLFFGIWIWVVYKWQVNNVLQVVKKPLMVSWIAKVNLGIKRNTLQWLDLWGTDTEPEAERFLKYHIWWDLWSQNVEEIRIGSQIIAIWIYVIQCVLLRVKFNIKGQFLEIWVPVFMSFSGATPKRMNEEESGMRHLSNEWNCTGSTQWAWILAAGSGWESSSSSRPSTGDATRLFRISFTLMPLLVRLLLTTEGDFSSSGLTNWDRFSLESLTSEGSAGTSSFVVSCPPTLWSKSDPFRTMDARSSPGPESVGWFTPLSNSFVVSVTQTHIRTPIIVSP